MRQSVVVALTGAAMLLPGAVQAAPVLDVYLSSAPNAFGSPSFAGYAANALDGLENGLANVGGSRAMTPTAYERLNGTFTAGDVMVTSFPSWRGQASPAAPFASELGNRIHGGLHIIGDGTTGFKLQDLTFAFHSGDPGDSLVYVGDFLGLDYNGTTRYGIDWGADNAKGGGDDTVFTSGNGGTLVDELVYLGVGNAFWPGGPGDPLTGQAALDASADYINQNVPWISVSYCIGGFCGRDIAYNAAAVPEPAALPLFALVLTLLGVARRRASKD